MTGIDRRALCTAATALLLLLLAAPAHTQDRTTVIAEPRGTAVGVSFVVDAGAAHDPGSGAATAFLAARAVLEDVRPQLAALDAQATLACTPAAVRYTLLAPPETWRVATDLFAETLFGHDIADTSIDRAYERLRNRVDVRRGNPVRRLEVLLAGALRDSAHAWARPDCLPADSAPSLDIDTVRSALRRHFHPSRTTIAVAGPVAATRARTLLRRLAGDAPGPLRPPAPERPPMPAFTVSDRNTVTASVGLAFPVGPDADPEALRLLGGQIQDALAPGPAHPDIHAVTASLERHGEGGTFIVRLTTATDQAEAIVHRVQELVQQTANQPLSDERFEVLLRRYRGQRLLQLTAPEDRAGDAAAQLFFDGAYQPTAERVDALTPDRLQAAAASLDEPAIAIIGPAGGDGGS